MALTPPAILPIGLTSSSEKQMHLPFFVTMITLFVPLVCLIPISSSPSFRFMAIRPVFLFVSKFESAVFLIVPCFVTAIRNLSSANSLIGITAVILSLCIKFRKFTAGVPFAVLVASGISYALILCAFPVLVKNMR